ncbi:MAG: outer membrane lipoprotein carrier protein LolA [Acidobacteria bacterium]|nr:outer membrane lipoprotein carrier protein LolA [Acidobacteriota bacterium]
MDIKLIFRTVLASTFLLVELYGQSPVDPGLDRLIDGLQGKYNRLSSLSALFVQIHTEPGGSPRRETGRLLLKKPGRMRWDYDGPEKKLYLSDGKSVYEYVSTDGYATRMSLRESDDWRAPFAFLLGRGNLRNDFKRIELDAESPARAGNRVLRLIPKKEQEFKILLIEVDPISLQLARLSFVDRNGARSDLLFSGLQENAPAAESRFGLPAGVEVRAN